MKYVKKPVVVEAFQFGVDDAPEWFTKEYGLQVVFHGGFPNKCIIRTLEGVMEVLEGNFIIKGIQGEIYPCKEDIFKETYKPYEEDDYTFGGRYQQKEVME
jgi:hypothetical protein